MFQENTFDLGSGDVDAAGNDQVVIAALEVKVPFRIADIDVTRKVPAVSHVLTLPIRKVKITASGWPANREQTWLAVRHRLNAVFIHHHRLIARNNFSCGAGARTARTT